MRLREPGQGACGPDFRARVRSSAETCPPNEPIQAMMSSVLSDNRTDASTGTNFEITAGVSLLYYLYEISEAIDLQRLQRLLGSESSKARLAFKYGAPKYLQFENPPLVIAGEPLEWRSRYSFQSRIKFYDYGVVSVTLDAPFAGNWTDFISLSAEVVGDPDLEAAVAALMERRLARLEPALVKPSTARMVEDYAIFGVYRMSEPLGGLEVAARHGAAIAQLLRGEVGALSELETAEVMGTPLSYHPQDLLVAGWNAAFVLDTPSGVEATAEIFEFANSQLLEFRYYDDVLSTELAAVYDEMEIGRAATYLFRSYRYRKTARRLNALYLDISELTEKSEHSLKFFGDLFASRVYRLAGQKLGLNEWRTLVDRKLQSAAVLYRSLIDEVTTRRMEFMELAIVLILVFELLIGLFHKATGGTVAPGG